MKTNTVKLVFAVAFVATALAARADDICGVAFTGNDVAASVGADWVRIPLYWYSLEPQRNGYDFSSANSPYLQLDNDLHRTAPNGLPRIKNPLVGIEAFASYLGTGASQAPCNPDVWNDMLARWRELWKVTTARYCASSASNPGQVHGVVRYWTVWNEPNAPNFLMPRASCPWANREQYCKDNPAACLSSAAEDYAELVASAEAGRQDGCPNDTKLVVGEVAQKDSSEFSQNLVPRLVGRVTPAVFSYHSYTFAIQARQAMESLRGLLNQYGYNQTELWMTEAGGPAVGSADCRSPGKDGYDGHCFSKREGFLRSMIAENRQYANALQWKRTFIFSSASLADPGDPDGYGLIHLNSAGAPIGSNMMYDALKAACNSPFPYMVLSGYNDNQDLKDACSAMATNNSADCSRMVEGNGKQMCLAMAQRSQSPCWAITDRNLQLACFGMSIKAASNCRDITNGNMRSFCYGVSTPDSSSCNGITEPNTKSLCLAMASGGSSYCANIPYVNDRNFCYGVSSRNTSYCANISYYADSVQR